MPDVIKAMIGTFTTLLTIGILIAASALVIACLFRDSIKNLLLSALVAMIVISLVGPGWYYFWCWLFPL